MIIAFGFKQFLWLVAVVAIVAFVSGVVSAREVEPVPGSPPACAPASPCVETR